MIVLRSLPACRRLVTLIDASPRDETGIVAEIKNLQVMPGAHLDAVASLALTSREVETMWDRNRDLAAGEGTWMHFTFESWLNRVSVDESVDEFRLFAGYVRTLAGLTAYRTEWMVHADEERLAGSIDFVAKDTCGGLVIFDWKRSKALHGMDVCVVAC